MDCFKKRKVVGLINSSTTCYMSSIIQALAASEYFIHYIENLKKLKPNDLSISLINDLIKEINACRNGNNSPKKATQILDKFIKSIQWNKSSQQDAFDLLATLLNAIENETKDRKTIASNPFYVNLVYTFEGINISSRTQKNLGLSVNLCGNYQKPPGVNLTYLINQHFVPSIIDGDPNKTSKVTFFETTPNVLLIHIQANKWDDSRGEMIKPNYFIRYEENTNILLDFVKDLNGEKPIKSEIRYSLKAVVHHTGNISQGHYVTYRKYGKKWFLINDDKVKKRDFDDKICPYILIYEKK